MNIELYSTKQTSNLYYPDSENDHLAQLVQSVTQSGICSDPASIINFYVALKTRPMAILSGPANSGKIALVQCLARYLTGDDCGEPDIRGDPAGRFDRAVRFQYQFMDGHPWWAEKSGNVSFFTEIHTRYNTEKLLCLIEEAWRPENSNKVFLACLARISPAELLSFFTEVAFQLRHGELVRFGNRHFSRPIPFPPNLFLIGTMDTDQFEWWDGDLLSQTTVIHSTGNGTDVLSSPSPGDRLPAVQEEFLRSPVRGERAVYQKLHAVLRWQRQPVQPLFLVEAILEKYDAPAPRGVIGEVIGYLANAWSRVGIGLFDPSPPRNLATALDFAISQILLPHAGERIRRSEGLRKDLMDLLNGQFLRSAAFLSSRSWPQTI